MNKNKKQKTTVIIKASRPAPKMVAELWCGDYLLGELIKENDSYNLEIFAHPKRTWKLELDEFISLLSGAKKQLEER